VLRVSSLVLLAVTLAVSDANAEPVRGRVAGVPAVNLREQPSTNSRAVTWLAEGEPVEVQGVVNGWALVQTARGQSGYIRRGYIEASENEIKAIASAQRAAQAAAPAAATPADPEPGPGREADLEAQVRSLREQLEELRRQATVTADAQQDRILREVRGDLRKLLEQTSAIERRLAAGAAGGSPAAPMQSTPPFPWMMLGFGILIGAVLGAAFGRRQERSRRTRIRI